MSSEWALAGVQWLGITYSFSMATVRCLLRWVVVGGVKGTVGGRLADLFSM